MYHNSININGARDTYLSFQKWLSPRDVWMNSKFCIVMYLGIHRYIVLKKIFFITLVAAILLNFFCRWSIPHFYENDKALVGMFLRKKLVHMYISSQVTWSAKCKMYRSAATYIMKLNKVICFVSLANNVTLKFDYNYVYAIIYVIFSLGHLT
jgi:hypothetical protein